MMKSWKANTILFIMYLDMRKNKVIMYKVEVFAEAYYKLSNRYSVSDANL